MCNWRVSSQLKTPRTIADIREIKQTADNKSVVQNLETMIAENLSYMLFRSIESTKCALSNTKESFVEFIENGIEIHEPISESEFTELSHENISQIQSCVENTLSDAGVQEGEIDLVLLTGGTSFIPAVKNIFFKKFGSEKILPIDAFTSVGYGLGLYANNL